jgi:hypothetical protein
MNAARAGRLMQAQFYVLLFSLPFEYYFAGPEHALFSTLKLQVLLIFTTWTLGQLFGRNGSAAVRPLPVLKTLLSDRLVLAVLVFIAVECAACAFAPVYRANAWTAGLKTAAGAFVAFICAELASTEFRPRTDILLFVLVLSGTCTALLGFGERAGIGVFVRIVNIFQPSRYFLGNHLRMVSTMEYPNTAGSILSVTICATLALMMFPASPTVRLWRPAYPLMLLLQVIALTLTYSRGAMGATILAVVAAAWAMRRFRNTYSVFALAACLLMLISGMAYLTATRRTAEVKKPVVSKRTAHFGLDAGSQTEALRAGRNYSQSIAVQNQSPDVWCRNQMGVAYRWYNFRTNETSSLIIGGEFPSDVSPGDSCSVPVNLKTPDEPGDYLLIWFVFVRSNGVRELKNSFSPGIVCSVGHGRKDTPAASGAAALYTGAIEGERRALNDALVPGRWELWSAAIRMVRDRPLLGIGPDNFRVLKWNYMDIPKGDDTILANNLYLELLSGSGALGLVSFLWLAWEFGRRINRAASLQDPSSWSLVFFAFSYFSAFLLHGLVDYFLKFTPTFLLFWLVLGTVSRLTPHGGAIETGV